MSSSKQDHSVPWITKRSHLQVSYSEVLPVIFKSRKAPTDSSTPPTGPVPPAFPATEVELVDSLPVVREWLITHLQRMHRVGTMNVKPGALETPDVVRNRKFRFTLWFEPTAAMFALMNPKEDARGSVEREKTHAFDGYVPTPQTLHIVGELEE